MPSVMKPAFHKLAGGAGGGSGGEGGEGGEGSEGGEGKGGEEGRAAAIFGDVMRMQAYSVESTSLGRLLDELAAPRPRWCATTLPRAMLPRAMLPRPHRPH